MTQLREVSAGGNFASQNPARVHVGLGAAAVADEVRVTWPDGLRQTFRDVAAGRTVVYRRPAARIFADGFSTRRSRQGPSKPSLNSGGSGALLLTRIPPGMLSESL